MMQKVRDDRWPGQSHALPTNPPVAPLATAAAAPSFVVCCLRPLPLAVSRPPALSTLTLSVEKQISHPHQHQRP